MYSLGKRWEIKVNILFKLLFINALQNAKVISTGVPITTKYQRFTLFLEGFFISHRKYITFLLLFDII